MAAKAPAAAGSTKQVAQATAKPDMAGAFLIGIVGTLVGFAGGICVLLSLIGLALHGPAAPLWLLIGIILLVIGAYCKFSSGQSVRTVR
jgi:amino acid transporter